MTMTWWWGWWLCTEAGMGRQDLLPGAEGGEVVMMMQIRQLPNHAPAPAPAPTPLPREEEEEEQG